MAGNQLNIDDVISRIDLSVAREEHPEERAARLVKETRAASIEDWKGVALFAILLLLLLGAVGLSAYEGIFDTSATADTKRWGQTVLSSLITGSVTFVLGRKTGSK